ncbi:uncharacterized protein LOC125892564 [Xyrichtys novacula]|uniref:Uncharacterized protein LOC125892564 n=1 Tax=Xyrichtys novacula TaxID=13765 RepID=A0AAV1EUB9_XYRNO|nr:uncharacterized protein LOC125892564 [Xyrichtys novacula]
MAGGLMLVFLMSFAPPKLTVNPAVITETDSVTLNCQPPSSVSQSKCYFRMKRGGPAKTLSCLQNLSGAELLKMTNKISPAEFNVTCFYLYGSVSPDSEITSIIVLSTLPPTLSVNPAVITETDSVTLNCQPPSSVSQSKCYFRMKRGGTAKTLSCLQNLSGAELLKMTNKISPAEFNVTCFYLYGSVSPESEISSIIVRSE